MGQTISPCTHKQVPANNTSDTRQKSPVKLLLINSVIIVRYDQKADCCDLWKGEQCTEWTGPLRSLNEKTAGALSVTLWPSEGAAAGVWEEKEHLSSRPPSEPTKKVSESQGDTAREVMPTVLLPRTYRPHKTTSVFHCSLTAAPRNTSGSVWLPNMKLYLVIYICGLRVQSHIPESRENILDYRMHL